MTATETAVPYGVGSVIEYKPESGPRRKVRVTRRVPGGFVGTVYPSPRRSDPLPVGTVAWGRDDQVTAVWDRCTDPRLRPDWRRDV